MEITVDDALKRAISAHSKGKLQEAERLYRAILKSYPKHPDANHNLGILKICENKNNEALPFLKAALEANPQMEQFWLSYVDVLIREGYFGKAKDAIQNAKKIGLDIIT